MGQEYVTIRSSGKQENCVSVPPGFASLTSFTLKRVEAREETCNPTALGSMVQPDLTNMNAACDPIGFAEFKRSLRHRPWILYDQCDHNDDSDPRQIDTNLRPETLLPKGVIHGCSNFSNCQKVTARWHPEDACTDTFEEAPVFHPTEEEFRETLKYIASLRPRAEPYGVCRIVPPPSWQRPGHIKEKNTWMGSKFPTQIQRVDKLQAQCSKRKYSVFDENVNGKKKGDFGMGLAFQFDNGHSAAPDEAGHNDTWGYKSEPGPEFTLQTFKNYADDFKEQYFCKRVKVTDSDVNSAVTQKQWEPSLQNIEGEYWRIVENPTEQIEVLHGAHLESGVLGIGFPEVSNQEQMSDYTQYFESGWNLSNTPKLPGSLLSFENNDIFQILQPRLHIGMCFSSLCWEVEEHHLYSLCFMHLGAPRIWYCSPGRYRPKFEAVLKKHPSLLATQIALLPELVVQLSPTTLKSEGISTYRCVQYPGEFVLFFPGAYHSGFDCGFNCTEGVNFAPVDWLPHGQNAVDLYCLLGRRTLISHDKLLFGAAEEAVRAQWELALLGKKTSDNLRWKNLCGKNGILAGALKSRIKSEGRRREYLCTSTQSRKMDKDFSMLRKRECVICFFDLHLSAACCQCSPDKYACLNHAKQLCSCSWSAKTFLFRYEMSKLDLLVQALEGKLSAVYLFAREELGLLLSGRVSKHRARELGFVNNPSHTELQQEQKKSQDEVFQSQDVAEPNGIIGNSTNRISQMNTSAVPQALEELKRKENAVASAITSSGTADRSHSIQREKPDMLLPEIVSSSSSSSSSESDEEGSDGFLFRKKQCLFSYSEYNNIAQRFISSSPVGRLTGSASEGQARKRPPSSCKSDIVLLSDDDGEEHACQKP